MLLVDNDDDDDDDKATRLLSETNDSERRDTEPSLVSPMEKHVEENDPPLDKDCLDRSDQDDDDDDDKENMVKAHPTTTKTRTATKKTLLTSNFQKPKLKKKRRG